jgi:hypothetical protein
VLRPQILKELGFEQEIEGSLPPDKVIKIGCQQVLWTSQTPTPEEDAST